MVKVNDWYYPIKLVGLIIFPNTNVIIAEEAGKETYGRLKVVVENCAKCKTNMQVTWSTHPVLFRVYNIAREPQDAVVCR